MSELAILFRRGHDFQQYDAEERARLPEAQRASMQHASQALAAALRFDCVKVAELLSMKIPRRATFGPGVPL